MRWGAAALALLLVLPGPGAAIADASAAAGETPLGEFIPAAPPQPAPALAFTDLAGTPQSLAAFAGRLILVNLWATWCVPCRQEMPSLERLQARFADAITIVAISEDRGGIKAVAPFLAGLGLNSVKIYLDPKSTAATAFKVEGLPSSFLIRDGKVLGRIVGAAEWDLPKIIASLKPFLDSENSGIVKISAGPIRP